MYYGLGYEITNIIIILWFNLWKKKIKSSKIIIIKDIILFFKNVVL